MKLYLIGMGVVIFALIYMGFLSALWTPELWQPQPAQVQPQQPPREPTRNPALDAMRRY